jgi:signal transduction histidine kinase
MNKEMNVNYKNFYKEIKKSYLMFFLSIVALTVIAQAGFQFVIHSQANFSNVINIAGRQRMLSQRIARFSNQLVTSRSLVVGNLLKDTVSLFKTSHQDLMNGNAENQISKPFTDEIQKNYYTLDPIVNNLTKSATCIIENCERTNDSLLYINNNADKFLKLMNETVFLSSAYAKTFVDMLSYAELAFFTLILLVMGIELFILLAPFNKRLIEILEKKDVEESSKQKLYHLAEIGEISAEISHEVNNITAIISGNTALLSKTIEKTTNDEKSIEYIRKISSNLKKIVNIHKSMGRLSRINLQGEFVPEQIKDDVLELLEHMIQKQNINFEFNIN